MKIHMHHAIVSALDMLYFHKKNLGQTWLFWYNMKICYIHIDFTVFLNVILLNWLYHGLNLYENLQILAALI